MKSGQTSLDWVLQWILRGSMTLIVAVGIILIVGKYIDVETANEASQRAILVQKVLHDDSITATDPVTGIRMIGVYDLQRIQDTKNIEAVLEQQIIYPKKWNSRAVRLSIGDNVLRYRSDTWDELDPVRDYKGEGASSSYKAPLVVQVKSSDMIVPQEAQIEVLERNTGDKEKSL